MEREIWRRRTLAIISHPDAGKTTLTEKLLLYGGALELAGSVKAKKHQRDTASDWMELEKKEEYLYHLLFCSLNIKITNLIFLILRGIKIFLKIHIEF